MAFSCSICPGDEFFYGKLNLVYRYIYINLVLVLAPSKKIDSVTRDSHCLCNVCIDLDCGVDVIFAKI